jgi:hypothetical protein
LEHATENEAVKVGRVDRALAMSFLRAGREGEREGGREGGRGVGRKKGTAQRMSLEPS